jgi:replicative DNA helicase
MKPPRSDKPTPRPLAPHSVEAEEAVLGGILIDPAARWDVYGFLEAGHFFLLKHEAIYRAIRRLSDRGDAIDYLTVVEDLRAQNELDMVGGAAYITHLINHTPSAIYTETYGQVVHRAAIRRALLAAAQETAKDAHSEDVDVFDILERTQARVLALAESGYQDRVQSVGTLASADMDRVAARRDGADAPGLLTGFTDLDKILAGMKPEDLLIAAGRPGMGKSAFLLTIALHLARAGKRVGLWSLEMSGEQIVKRLIAMVSGIPLAEIIDGKLADAQWAEYVKAVAEIDRLGIYIDDTPGLTPLQLRVSARRIANQKRLDLVLVDYLQLMEPAGAGSQKATRNDEVSYISRQLKLCARELHLPVIAAAQLSRAVESRQDKRPLLSDLRDSGSIEQDADVVMFLYRDDYYNPEFTERPNQVDVIVSKHRNGPTGVANLFFKKELTQLANLRKTSWSLADDGKVQRPDAAPAPIDLG